MAALNPQTFDHSTTPNDFQSTLELLRQGQKQDSEIALQNLERAKQYTTLVVSLGYAGMFATWNFCSDFIPHRASSLTALLVGTSLGLFIIFEIVKMFTLQIVAMRQFNSVNLKIDADSLEGLMRFIEEQKRRRERTAEENFDTVKKLAGLWPYFFYPTVVLGFGGMFLLFYNAAAHLTGSFPFFPA